LTTPRHDDAHLRTDQVRREGGVPIILALGPSELESDVLPFHIAQLAQALAEGLETALSYRVRRGARIWVTYPGHLPRLLPLGGERRGEDGSGTRDEGPAVHHSIT